MAASQATMEALKRESRANVKEDTATLASEARQKVDRAMAEGQALLSKVVHPMDKQAREAADIKANSLKRQSSEKQSNLREMARQQAEQERAAARISVANQVAGGAAGMRYPVPVPPSSQQDHQPPTQAAEAAAAAPTEAGATPRPAPEVDVQAPAAQEN